MIKPTRRLSLVDRGELMSPLEKVFTTVDLMAYGAATWDWHRMHYDLEFARSMNLPNVIVDGQAYGALFARAALDWAGPKAFVVRLSLRMRAMAFAGDRLLADGVVTEIGGQTVVLEQRLTSNGRLVAEATTEVRLPG